MISAKTTKIVLLGDINSIHLQKWISGLADEFELAVFSLDPPNALTTDFLKGFPAVLVRSNAEKVTGKQGNFSYLFSLKQLKSLYKSFQPDIVHAHYASSYGMLGKLLFPKHFCISAWGSDIFEFPKRSWLHKQILRWITAGKSRLFSTSEVMKAEWKHYTGKPIEVIPFGIDTDQFTPKNRKESAVFTIGTVKTLEYVYGIDRLIEGFARFHKLFPASRCLIYGSGSQETELRALAEQLGIGQAVHWKGFITHDLVPDALAEMDVFCALSRRESFGVAVVEASAMGLPVIVSNVGGLPEVVKHAETGFVIEPDSDEWEYILLGLADNEMERQQLGEAGRDFVLRHFDWKKNVVQMKSAYRKMIR